MKSLKELCSPRKSAFDQSRRDVVLDVSDLIGDRIEPETFFAENYITHGMRDLLVGGFRRLAGKSDQGIFVLSQAMGGGKTHNMITLGLLAKHPGFRKKVLEDTDHQGLGASRVIGFTGRESDAPLGIWGSLADQLGKKELFKDYYTPLQAPGVSAWINLLKGEPLLILLDELPPYFTNARSKSIGDGNLAEVTSTALANLLTAVAKDELSGVCVVISDLKATYGDGSAQLNRALDNFQNEVGRSAMTLEPVGLNTNELYHILRTRIFEGHADRSEVESVARAYAQAVKDAKQMDITHASPEDFAAQLADSFPFHFSIKDLYARFRENPGFQQTRGLIRLMRVVVSRLWESGRAASQSLIHPYDIDLNDEATKNEIRSINAKLENAISHDIAGGGVSVAENLDKNSPGGTGTDAQDAAKLLFVSSLANVPGATLGLNASEVVSYLCRPGRDASRLLKDVLGVLKTKAWYLHANREGKLFFKNTENLIAKVHTTAESYSREVSLKELQQFLKQIFEPKMKDCYHEAVALEPVDEITLGSDKITLVISEPSSSGGLADDLSAFWEDAAFKNRVAFLSGDRQTMSALLENAAELKAVGFVIKEMEAQKTPDGDPQFASAQEMHDAIRLRLLSAARESFTRLHYPGVDGLLVADFLMNFSDNNYNGEKQIRAALAAKQKFTEDIDGDTFRKKCEQRLFTQQVMPFSEVKKRAAMNPRWQWHHPSALENLKNRMILEEQWREDGGYIDKGPFPAPSTEVRVQVLKLNDDTGAATLRITPVHGDTVHYEIGSSPATTASSKIENLQNFVTTELRLSFLAVDSKGGHETSTPTHWKNRITLKSRTYQQGEDKMCELQSAPPAPIAYTTDGSDPRSGGGVYDAPFPVPKGAVCVLAVAQKDGIASEVQRIDIDWSKIDGVSVNPTKPALWRRPHHFTSTKETYEFLARMNKFSAASPGCRITVAGEKKFIDVTAEGTLDLGTAQIESILTCIRAILTEGQVELNAPKLRFPTGQHLLDWVADAHTEIKPGEVEQQDETGNDGDHGDL